MADDHACQHCGASLEGRRPNAKYCNDLHRKRAQRGGVVDIATRRKAGRPSTEPRVGSVASATRTELAAVKRVSSALGQAALALATRLDSRVDTGSALASLNKEWRATLAASLANTRANATPLDLARDELAKRRAKRGA